MIKKAVIVAAGLSSRLYPLTLNEPKGLLIIKDQSLIERSVHLLTLHGVSEIALVVGYKRTCIQKAFGGCVSYIPNPFYKECNNMGSLWFAREFVGNDSFIYLHGDIVYDEEILLHALSCFAQSTHDIELVTDFGPTDEEAMKVRVDEKGFLIDSSKEISIYDAHGEWIGMALIRKAPILFSTIEQILFEEGLHFYDTHAFTKLAKEGHSICCSPTNDRPWVEIDFQSDYSKAQEMFG